jgi:creatinine amidohydrolase
MKIEKMNWMQVEKYLQDEDRAVVPLGSTEQHAYLSLSTDTILAERVALEAAEGENVVVFPPLAFGIVPYFGSYPGSISLRVETYLRILGDLLESLQRSGFRRVLFVNGHGGNIPGATLATEWSAAHPEMRIKWHNWWAGPEVMKVVNAIDPIASHASWMENFPWTRLAEVTMPDEQVILPDTTKGPRLSGDALRAHLGTGNFGGYYQRNDEEVLRVWAAGVAETRDLLANHW